MSWRRYAALCSEEPFRILFPVGLLFGFVGVLLWPLFFFGSGFAYPAVSHARLMIQSMMGCFIFGFLGTAGPRLMSVPHFTGRELLRLLVLVTAASGAHLFALHAAGDGLFLVALLLFVFSLGKRFRRRQDSPPPHFLLVGLGMLNGIAGTALLFWAEATASAPQLYRVGNSLLHVGFVLLPVLGVSPFFLRRLLDLETDVTANARRTFVLAAVTAVVIELSLVLEVFTSGPAGWLRAAVALLYLGMTLPWRGSNALAAGLRMSLAATVAGLGLMALLPEYRISAAHVLFIGGFSVAIFSVATRVVLGHSGKLALVQHRRGWFIAALVLVILAMVSRFVGDFVASRNAHLVSAAICWLVAAAIWGALVMPKVAVAEEE